MRRREIFINSDFVSFNFMANFCNYIPTVMRLDSGFSLLDHGCWIRLHFISLGSIGMSQESIVYKIGLRYCLAELLHQYERYSFHFRLKTSITK